MKKVILIIGFIFLVAGLKSQTTICPTVADIHFFIYKNDTVILEPTKVSPGTSVITNYSQVGSEIFISDCDSLCRRRIQLLGLKGSIYSTEAL